MKKIMILMSIAMLLLGITGQAMASFDNGHLIQVVYQRGGLNEVATDLGPFVPTTPDANVGTSFTSHPFPAAGSGAFPGATWGNLQIAYFVMTSTNAWTSGPNTGQTSGNRKWAQFSSPATAVSNKYASLGTAQGQLLQSDLNSYVNLMDLGDPINNAGYFSQFIPLKNGEQNLANLGTTGYVDSYVYYYASPDNAAAGVKVARIRAFADGHSQVLSVVVTPPNAPTSVVATEGNGQATVTFSASAPDGGPAVTGYTVTSSPAGGTDTSAGSTSLTHIITGLTNGISYTFTVTATNDNGTSAPSAASNIVTPGVPSPLPGKPTNVVAVAGVGTATVTFSAPVSGGSSTITGYTVISNPAGGIDGSVGKPGLSHIVKGLIKGTAYTFTVTAKNLQGTGLPSDPSNSVIPDDLPGAPLLPVATPAYKKAIVTFTAPLPTIGGLPITGYTVVSLPAGGVDSNAGSTALTHTMTGLTNGTPYTFTVVATNAIGNGKASAATKAATPLLAVPVVSVATTPTYTTIGKIWLTKDNRPTWSWTHTTDGGSHNYVYWVMSNIGGVISATTGSTTTSELSYRPASGLADGVYTLYVQELDALSVPSAAGMTMLLGKPQGITTDATLPVTTITDVAIKTSVTDTTRIGTVTFKFTTEKTKGTTLSCSIDGGAYELCKSPKAYLDLAPGMHMFSVKATDLATNETFAPSQFTFSLVN